MANNFEEIIRIVLKLQGREAADQMREALRGLSDSAEDLKESGQGLLDDIANTAKAQAAVAGIRDVGANVLQLSRDLGPARDKVAALYAEIQAAEKPTQRQQKAFEDSRKSLRNLEAAYDAQRAKLGEYRATIEAQGLSITKLSAAEETLTERRRQALDALQAEAAAARAAREETERAAVAAAEQAKAEAAATSAAQESARAAEAKRKAVEAEAEAIRQIRIEADKQARATREQAEIDARATREQAKRTEEARRAKTELQQLTGAVRDLGAQSAEAGARAQVLYDQFVDAGNAQAAVVAFRDTGAEVRRLATELDTARASVGEMARAMAQAEAPTRQQAEALEKQRAALRQIEATYDAQKAKLRALRTELQAQGLATNNLVAAEKILATRRREAIAAINSEVAAEKAARAETEALAKAKKAEASAMREAEKQATAAAAAAKKLASETAAVGKGADGVASVTSSLGRMLPLAAAVAVALRGISAIGDLFAGAMDSSRGFERELDGVRAVSNATAQDMERFRDAAEFATEKTKFGAQEAARALGELARATGSAQTAIAALPATTALAQAANIELAQSAQFITTTLAQFGLAADQAGRVADVLAKAANSTTADVQGLALSLSYAAPLARQLGMNLEETTAVIGALADQGFRGERAGTALRNVFTQLADPASEFRIALLGAGVAGDDFITILEGLVTSGDAGKRALMALDAEARPAILALVNSGGKGLRQLKADLDAATGSVDETAKTMGDNFDGAVLRFVNALDAARRALVDPLLEPLKEQFDAAAVRVREFIKTADFAVLQKSVKDFVLSASEAFIEFIRSVDFTALAQSIQDFAANAKDSFTAIKENAEVLAAGLSVAVNAISAMFNGLQTVLTGSSAAIASTTAVALKSALAASEAINALLPEYAKQEEGVARLRLQYEAVQEVADKLWQRTLKNAEEAGQAVRNAASAAVQLGEAVETTATKVEGLGDASGKAGASVAGLGNELGLLPDYTERAGVGVNKVLGPVQDLGRDALLTAQHVTRFDDALQQVGDHALRQLRENLAAAEREFSRLLTSSERTPASLAAANAAWSAAAQALRDYENSAYDAEAASKRLETAAGALGIQSMKGLEEAARRAKIGLDEYVEAARRGAVSQEAVNQAFEVYAQRQLELANASGASARARILAEVQVQAAITGNNAKLDEMLQKYAALANTPAPPPIPPPPIQPFQELRQEVNGTTDAIANASNACSDFARRSSGLMQNAANAIAKVRSEFTEVSDAAAQAFDTILVGLERTHTSIGAGAGFDTLAENLQIAAAETRQAVEDQRAQLQLMIGELSSYGNAAADAFGQAQPSVEQMTERMAVLREQLELGASDFQLLGDQDLGLLRQALDSASQRVDALADKARSAQDALVSMARASQDALDEAAGNVDDIEKRRYEEQLKRIDELAKQGGAEAQAAAELARKKAQEEHALRLRQIEERRQREIEADNEVANNRRRNEQQQSSGGGTGNQQQGSQQSQGGRAGGAMTTVNINWGRGSIQATGTAQNMREFLTELKRSAQMGGYGVA